MRDSVLYKKKRKSDEDGNGNDGGDGDLSDVPRPLKSLKVAADAGRASSAAKAKAKGKAKGKAAGAKESAKAKQKAVLELKMKKALGANLGRDLQGEAEMLASASKDHEVQDHEAEAGADHAVPAAKAKEGAQKKKGGKSAQSIDVPEDFHISRDDGTDKLRLDGVFAAMYHATNSIDPPIDSSDKMQMIGCALDFCFNSKLDVAGTTFSAWSKLRPKLQDALRKARRAPSSSSCAGKFLMALNSATSATRGATADAGGGASSGGGASGAEDKTKAKADAALAMQRYSDRVAATPMLSEIAVFMSELSRLPPKHHRCVNKIIEKICDAHLESALELNPQSKSDIGSKVMDNLASELETIVPQKWVDLVMEGLLADRFAFPLSLSHVFASLSPCHDRPPTAGATAKSPVHPSRHDSLSLSLSLLSQFL